MGGSARIEHIPVIANEHERDIKRLQPNTKRETPA